MTALLDVRNLETRFGSAKGWLHALRDVSFSVDRSRILGIVGESGSGKSLTAKSIMRMVPEPGLIAGGEILYKGRDLTKLPEEEMRKVRGREIAMIFQDPQAALNPVKTVGWQIEEALVVHGASRDDARRRAMDLLLQVGIPDAGSRIGDYPHQLSGGMRQRVVIAIAIANAAPLIVADEPTTALDVTIQAQVLRLLVDLRDRLGVTVILITHDMGVVAELCDDIVVMYAGRVVERGRTADIFASPQHPYTRALLHSMPAVGGEARERLSAIPGATPDLSHLPRGCAFHPRCIFAENICRDAVPQLEAVPQRPQSRAACHVALREGQLPPQPGEGNAAAPTRRPAAANPILELRNLKVTFGSRRLFGRRKQLVAVDNVSLAVRPGETLGLVGESGCGKTSLSRTIVGLYPASEGQVIVDGEDVTSFDGKAAARVRATVQYVFQDPFASLNPRLTIRQVLSEALEMRGVTRNEREPEARKLLELVGLDPDYLGRYPRAFSGGQRQRIGIARALAVEPRVLICDEPVSALDVSIQAQVINVLADLRDRLGLAVLFIAHDLAVVRHLSDRVAVMYLGRIVEEGTTAEIFTRPRHPYTAVLLASTPQPIPDPHAMSRKAILRGDVPSPSSPPSGCRFRTRCPIGPLAHPSRTMCIEKDPPLTGEDGHRAACHFQDDAILAGGGARRAGRADQPTRAEAIGMP